MTSMISCFRYPATPKKFLSSLYRKRQEILLMITKNKIQWKYDQ